MTDWVKQVKENGVSALPRDIQKALNKIEGMPGDPAKSFMRRKGFENLKDEKYDRGRQVWTHEDTEDLVYKVAVRNGQWQNEIETTVWFDGHHPSFSGDIEDDVRKYLVPILDSDIDSDEDRWLIMPRAEMGTVTEKDAVRLIEKMKETGWIVTDYHEGNIGYYEGLPVFIDYGQMKPVRFLDDDWRERIQRKDFE